MHTFSFNPLMKHAVDWQLLIAVTSFETTNTEFNKIDKNISFSITTPGHWSSWRSEETVNKINNSFELRSHS